MIPEEPGLYLVYSDDDNNWTPVIVSHNLNNELVVCDPFIGTYELKHYHNGLMNPIWKSIN